MVWRDALALRGGALSFYWIIIGLKKGGGIAVVCGGGYCNKRLQFVPLLSSACGCRELLVLFLLPVISSPGDQLRRVKRPSCLTRSQAC